MQLLVPLVLGGDVWLVVTGELWAKGVALWLWNQSVYMQTEHPAELSATWDGSCFISQVLEYGALGDSLQPYCAVHVSHEQEINFTVSEQGDIWVIYHLVYSNLW